MKLRKDISAVDTDMAGKVIGVGIALFVTAILMPMGLNALANSSKTGMPNVDSNVKIMLAILLPVLGVVGIALMFYRHANSGD